MSEDDRKYFLDLWKTIKQRAREIFQKDKRHSHMIFLLRKNEISIISYDQLVSGLLEKEKGKELDDEERTRLFEVVASVAYEQKATGFIDIGEGWALVPHSGGTLEEVLDQFKTAKENYGFIKNMPTRMEVLFIHGRYREFSASTTYKIKRMNDECWLVPLEEGVEEDEEKDIWPYEPDDVSRMGMIHRAIDRVLAEEVPSPSGRSPQGG